MTSRRVRAVAFQSIRAGGISLYVAAQLVQLGTRADHTPWAHGPAGLPLGRPRAARRVSGATSDPRDGCKFRDHHASPSGPRSRAAEPARTARPSRTGEHRKRVAPDLTRGATETAGVAYDRIDPTGTTGAYSIVTRVTTRCETRRPHFVRVPESAWRGLDSASMPSGGQKTPPRPSPATAAPPAIRHRSCKCRIAGPDARHRQHGGEQHQRISSLREMHRRPSARNRRVRQQALTISRSSCPSSAASGVSTSR